jgi:hypothetical protein
VDALTETLAGLSVKPLNVGQPKGLLKGVAAPVGELRWTAEKGEGCFQAHTLPPARHLSRVAWRACPLAAGVLSVGVKLRPGRVRAVVIRLLSADAFLGEGAGQLLCKARVRGRHQKRN